MNNIWAVGGSTSSLFEVVRLPSSFWVGKIRWWMLHVGTVSVLLARVSFHNRLVGLLKWGHHIPAPPGSQVLQNDLPRFKIFSSEVLNLLIVYL